MDEDFIQPQTDTSPAEQPSWNLDEMVDQLSRTLHQQVDPLTIRLTLVDILDDYEDVPIKTFVPILACREAQEALKRKPRIRL
jgi:hypothetical protein